MASRLPWEQFTFFDKHNIHENVAALIVRVEPAVFVAAVLSLRDNVWLTRCDLVG